MKIHQRQHRVIPLLFTVWLITACLIPATSYSDSSLATAPNTFEQQITTTSNELTNLTQQKSDTSNENRLDLHFQIFRKNTELRDLLSNAVKHSTIDSAFLIKHIKQQQAFTQNAMRQLSEQSSKLSSAIDTASNENKLPLLSEYSDIKQQLDSMYQHQSQSIAWLKSLNVKISADEQANHQQRILLQAKKLVSNVYYLQQQIKTDKALLNIAPEAEKAAIQLKLLVINRRMEIATSSLNTIAAIAEAENLPVAEYKRLYFEAIGNLTHDLLNPDVLLAITKAWCTKLWNWLLTNTPQYMFQVFIFFIILLLTRKTAKITGKAVQHFVENESFDFSQLMQKFFTSMSSKIVWCIGFLIALSQIGLDLTPVLTGFGIAGLIIGFALQDTLSNFAAGMMLLIYRPFDVDDFVVAGGVEGKVYKMSLVNTSIKTFDNQFIIIPNSKIWGDVIKNVTHEKVRRIDMVFGVSYSDNIEFVENILLDIVSSHPSVLHSPEPLIKLHVLNSSSLDFIVRPWVKTPDYWRVYWDITREVKIRFDKEVISIPFPQQDVHLHTVPTS